MSPYHITTYVWHCVLVTIILVLVSRACYWRHRADIKRWPTVPSAVWLVDKDSITQGHCALFATGSWIRLAAWRSGNGVGRINEVTLRRARLVRGWVTVVAADQPMAWQRPPTWQSDFMPLILTDMVNPDSPGKRLLKTKAGR